jgi:hypothetical protein
MSFGVLELLLVFIAGLGVGLLAGIFGCGGGFLLVPVLNIVLGIPIELAVGAGACQVLGPATTSLLARGIRLADLRFPLTVAGGLFIGTYAGARLLNQLSKSPSLTAFSKEIPFAEVTVLVIYFLLLSLLGSFSLWETHRHRAGEELRTGYLTALSLPPYAHGGDLSTGRVSIPVLAWFGVGVGFLAGLLGMSGGLVLLPGLIYLFRFRTQAAVTNSLAIVWLVALPSTALHAWHGHVDLGLVSLLLIGGTFGARFGAELGQRLGSRELREGFGWLLIATATLVGFRLLRMVGVGI